MTAAAKKLKIRRDKREEKGKRQKRGESGNNEWKERVKWLYLVII